MIRFALIVASTLGFVLTAALGNFMAPLLQELERFRPQEQQEPQTPVQSRVPVLGGLCLMVSTLAAVGVGWTAACIAQPTLLGSESQLMTRLLIALFGAQAFGAIGLADDAARLRSRAQLGLPQPSTPARYRQPQLPGRSFAGGKFHSRKASSAPASAAGSTASGNQPSRVSSTMRPSMAAKAVPHTVPSAPSAVRAHSASATSTSSHSTGAAPPSST